MNSNKIIDFLLEIGIKFAEADKLEGMDYRKMELPKDLKILIHRYKKDNKIKIIYI